MFDFDSFREIISTIKKNKLRTFLTGLAVTWGIFMLIVLLGFANGFRNATMTNFSDRANNTISVNPGWTSMPYHGTPSNKEIKLDYRDYDLIRSKITNVEYLSPQISKSGTIAYEKQFGSWRMTGVSPDFASIMNVKIQEGSGRFINEIDMKDMRKVIVINSDMKKVLFKDENPIGKYVISNKIVYQVIGVYDRKNQFNNDLPAYVPFSTAQLIFKQGGNFDRISFTVKGVNTEEASETFEKTLRKKIAAIHRFDPEDMSAIYVRNTAKDSAQTAKILNIINLFILIIGAASLVAGIVGVGNIMLITVKERTREIGIRKAIGASSGSILRLIITEAIFITTAAGYVGIVLGTAITGAIGFLIEANATGDGPSMLKDPTVDLFTVVIATLALILCGVGAGLIPALKATRVSPIEAMRAE
ncbi:MAG: multidrug transporter substrate-binding protein [Bacteroidetes bacterium]|nr:multidrug transporter substrate-binding protein [Bacteroidota bacterium]